MFIKKLGLKNFKCFKEVEVDFAKITLLTGENSSGKSSLTYGLLAPFQSEGFPLYLFPNGKYVNMGDFEEISYRNIKNNKIEVNIEIEKLPFYFDVMEIFGIDIICLNTEWVLDTDNQLPKLNHLKFNYLKKPFIAENSIEKQDFGLDHFFEISNYDNTYLCNLSGKNHYDKNEFSIVKDLRINNLNEVYNLESEDKRSDEISRIFSELLKTRRVLQKVIDFMFNFLSSYRFYPERTYYQKPKLSSQLLPSGEGFIDQILEWQEKKSENFENFISILKDLKLLYDIKPQKLGGGRFDLRVKVKKSSNWASLADVGFGVSQLLPIIVADLQLSNHSTLIMAQPETHLHPSIQAELGSYLVKQVHQRDKQYIVETHSEYLINRLRLSIVKGEIEPEDVAVYYFENTVKEGSIAHQIQFTKQGQILDAPQGFFDTYMIDTMDIALNA